MKEDVHNRKAGVPEKMLEVNRVAKSYGSHAVLTDVSFSVAAGELVAVTGENGAGKSTLLRILVGLQKPDEGTVIRNARTGYCPQEQTVFESLTVRENFRYFGRAYGMSSDKAARSAAALMDRFGFRRYEDMLVANLSGGTRQKLNLCIGLLHDPELLVLDEPYAGFDWETYLHFWDYASGLKIQGRSVLVVSHLVYDQSRFDLLYEISNGMLECVSPSSHNLPA